MTSELILGILSGILISSILDIFKLGLNEAIIKPIVVRFTQNKIKKYIKPLLTNLDEKLNLPENFEKLLQDKSDWILDTVIPEVVEEDLNESELKSLIKETLKEFNLNIFLEKKL